jgi:hypothetical protein
VILASGLRTALAVGVVLIFMLSSSNRMRAQCRHARVPTREKRRKKSVATSAGSIGVKPFCSTRLRHARPANPGFWSPTPGVNKPDRHAGRFTTR